MAKSAITTKVGDKDVPLGEVLAWDGDRLTITDPAVVAKARRPALSPSTAKSMEGCPSRWLGERLIAGEPDPFSPSEIGTAGHAVMEDLFELPVAKRTAKAAMGILIKHSKKMWPDDPNKTTAEREQISIARAQWISDVNFAYKGLFDIEDPTTVMVRRNEWKMDGVEVNGVPFIGFIDRTDVLDGEHGAESKIVDYKTGKQPAAIAKFGDAHGDQLRLYAAAVAQMDGRMPTEAWVYYTKFGKSKKVALSASKMNDTLFRFKKSWDMHNRFMDEASFPTVISALCGWCPLVKVCPTAAANSKEARIVVPSITDLGIPIVRAYGAPDPALIDDTLTEPEETLSERDFEPNDPSLLALEAKEQGVPTEALVAEQATRAVTPDPSDSDDPTDNRGTPTPENSRVGDRVLDPVLDTGTPSDDWGSDFGPTPVLEPSHAALNQVVEETTPKFEATAVSGKESIVPTQKLQEDKPWEPKSANGRLNPTSYAAIGVFGVVELAVESLHSNGQSITGSKVTALAGTFATVVANAQSELTGSTDPQQGANTRLRGALRSTIKTIPLPFGEDDAAWANWVDTATRRCLAISTVAVSLYENGIPDRPWGALV